MLRQPLPLRVHLLFLVLGAMLPGALLTATLVSQTFSQNRAVIERRLLDAARVDAAALDREFQGHIQALEALATSPALAQDDLRGFHAEAVRIRQARRDWDSVLLLSPAGDQLVSSRFGFGTPLLKVHEPASLERVVRERQPTVGTIRPPQRDGIEFGFAVRVPVMRGEDLKYVLTAIVDVASLATLVGSQLPASEEWTRTILDSSGRVAARTRRAETFVGTPATPSFLARAQDPPDGVFSETSIDGTAVYAAIRRSSFGWVTSVIVPRAVLDAPLRGSTLALIVGGTLLMVGTLAALVLVSRRLSRELDRVTAAAESLPAGHLPPSGRVLQIAETRRLQDSLISTAELLDQRRRERDDEVTRAEAARAQAEEANRTKDQFLAVLGHELRNPLAPALTALELMRMKDANAFRREREVLERQVGHMVRLVNDLLDVSRLARGKIEIRTTRFELRRAVDRAVDMARPPIDAHGHLLRVEVPAEGLVLDADEDRIVQVLANLLNNAARYIQPGGHITLSAERRDGVVEIACADDGPGIPGELLPQLFEPFSQGPRTLDRQQGGLGLGLALARKLVELHGGTIELDASHQPGARLVIRLRAAAGPAADADAEPPVRPRRLTRRHLLLVDDNVDAADMLRAGLEDAGYTVATGADADSALVAARAVRPDIGVLDIGLPGTDGYTLARVLRAEHPGIRLIALTGYGQPADAAAAAAAGFDAHCTKPISLTALLDQIEGPS